MKKPSFVVLALCVMGTANAGIPFFNATCPGNIEVHADQGGPVFFHGKQGRIKKSQASHYEVEGAGITLSIAIDPDDIVAPLGQARSRDESDIAQSNDGDTHQAPPVSRSRA